MRSTQWRNAGWIGTVSALILASGCTGTDVVDSGNQLVSIQVVLTGATEQHWDCVNFTFGQIAVRPLDGHCSPQSDQPGAPCLLSSDCPGGSCQGSKAAEIVPESGIWLLSSDTRNFDLDGTDCVPVVGKCNGPDPDDPCTILDPASCDPGDTCVTDQVAAVAFQVPATTLPAGLYQVTDLLLGGPTLYNATTGTLESCDANPADITTLLSQPIFFTFDSAHSNVIHLVVNLHELESALTTPPCDFFGNLQSIISVE